MHALSIRVQRSVPIFLVEYIVHRWEAEQ